MNHTNIAWADTVCPDHDVAIDIYPLPGLYGTCASVANSHLRLDLTTAPEVRHADLGPYSVFYRVAADIVAGGKENLVDNLGILAVGIDYYRTDYYHQTGRLPTPYRAFEWAHPPLFEALAPDTINLITDFVWGKNNHD